MEFELLDCRREGDVDRHDLNSTNTILNVHGGIKNRSRTRNSHHGVLTVAKINLALQRKIDIFGCGIQEFERCMVAAKSQSSTCAGQIERRILQNPVEQLHFTRDVGMREVLTERDRSAQ